MDHPEFFRRVPDLFQRAHRSSWEKYEETIFSMQRPVTHGNYQRVKQFMGGNPPTAALRDPRPYPELDRQLSKAKYPRAGQLTRLDDFADGSTELATALLHFNQPAYPIYDALSVRGLNHLGHPINFVREVKEEAGPAYQAYTELIQGLKDEIPYTCVPEKNYYLTRIIQESLWQLGLEVPAPVTAKRTTKRAVKP